MNCLKCGKETKEHQVFCDSCLQAMEQHPVKPGTPIHLPHRTAQSGPKKPRKRALPADEQIAILKKRSRRLTLFLVLTLLALLLALSALGYLLLQTKEEQPAASQPSVVSTRQYVP